MWGLVHYSWCPAGITKPSEKLTTSPHVWSLRHQQIGLHSCCIALSADTTVYFGPTLPCTYFILPWCLYSMWKLSGWYLLLPCHHWHPQSHFTLAFIQGPLKQSSRSPERLAVCSLLNKIIFRNKDPQGVYKHWQKINVDIPEMF